MSNSAQVKKKEKIQRYGPDSVHSWMTAGACCLSSFFASSAGRSGGFIFVAVQETWQTNRRDAAWPVLMMTAGIQASGVLSGPLAQRFTVRPVTIFGSVLSSVGLILSSFAPNTTILTLSLGAIHGIGAGMVIMSQPMCLVQHFDTYKGLATGLNFAGAAMAFFVFPIVLEFLTETYGFRGAMLLLGAISLNAMAFTLFLRKPEWLGQCTTISKSEKGAEPHDLRKCAAATHGSSVSTITVHMGNDTENISRASRDSPNAPSTHHKQKQMKYLGMAGSVQTAHSLITPGEPMTIKFTYRRMTASAFLGSVASAVETVKQSKRHEPGSLRHGLSVLKEPMFYLILYTFFCYSVTLDCYTSLLVDFAVGKGIPLRSAVAMTSISGLVDLVARLLLPSIADRDILSRRTMLVMVKVMITIVMFLFPHVSSYAAIFALACCTGLYVGCVVVMCSVLIAEFLGVDRVPLTYGLVTGLTGLTAFGKPPLIGYFRDRMGSYDAVFLLCGLLQLLCFLLWFCVCVAGMLYKRRNWSPQDEIAGAAAEVSKYIYLPCADFVFCSRGPRGPKGNANLQKVLAVVTRSNGSCSVTTCG
uniref:Putative monocarboxylate transporter n=1 Tax=Hyalomma excavatum TaxID=257692 RepID=A0A131XIU1_9ACAR